MDKQNTVYSQRPKKPELRQEVKPEPKIEKTEVANTSQQTTIKEAPRVAIRLIYESTMRYSSPTTGELYTWNKIGDVVMVATEDAEYLVNKRLGGTSCCGGHVQNGNKIFELVE